MRCHVVDIDVAPAYRVAHPYVAHDFYVLSTTWVARDTDTFALTAATAIATPILENLRSAEFSGEPPGLLIVFAPAIDLLLGLAHTYCSSTKSNLIQFNL